MKSRENRQLPIPNSVPFNRYIAQYDRYLGPILPLNPDQNRKIGQMSLTEGVFIPREVPADPDCDLAEVMEVIDNQ